ncbi:hypothetical protein AAFC00_005998 [Neodothiora populina]|uniref:Uncharacterized protein n=1 Tax=Neodothiora populina TaxID=2781224 RepID=A0ABR3P7Y3_9PEZI
MARDMSAPGNVKVPIDLLHSICTELALRLDFATLFNCIASSKHFADAGGALANLYRISHLAPESGNEAFSLPEQEQLVQKWSIRWRTIILSCFGQTMFPYVRYLRVLDLRDLHELFDDDKFRGKIFSNFFTGPLATFDFMAQITGTRQQKWRSKGIKLRANIVSIGETIVGSAPMLEEVTEPSVGEYNILSEALIRWTPQLGRLQSLELWDGKTLGDETLRNLLHAHCPHLRRISIYQWREDESDHKLAEFISNMPRNTLSEFENHAECGIGPETCLAFNTHGSSLKALNLALPEKGISSLGLLQGCTSVETLKLTDLFSPHDLKATENEVLLDMISWLKNCEKLRELSLTGFSSAPDILTEVLNMDEIQLEDLQINARDDSMYILKDHTAFHLAIGRQKKLRSLLLKCDPEPLIPDARDALVGQICQLHDLKYLKLTRTSDWFQDQHIQALAKSLSVLEELLVAGWALSDASLQALSNLSSLKSITFNGPSNFSADGLIDFINRLGPGNQGLAVSIDMANTDTRLTNEEQYAVRDALMNKVQGRFEYQLTRDPDVPEFYDESDSD